MSIFNNQYSSGTGSSSCTCEDCSRYKAPPSYEQSSDTTNIPPSHFQQPNNTSGSTMSTAASATSHPTTYLARRPSAAANSATSPKMQPAGFGLGTSGPGGGARIPPMMQPHQRRASFEFHNRERIQLRVIVKDPVLAVGVRLPVIVEILF
ncbi:hypothetical protein BG011_009332 [Mortierella polycephala]|uniref:Uncharacterized protein n=1 Tax=Mortierella polycephala TaxID=41804 RepID=A0A9P6PMF3_9FUNG|nr:hypothetical protein BG011_009332 [Mortierella polycephala]